MVACHAGGWLCRVLSVAWASMIKGTRSAGSLSSFIFINSSDKAAAPTTSSGRRGVAHTVLPDAILYEHNDTRVDLLRREARVCVSAVGNVAYQLLAVFHRPRRPQPISISVSATGARAGFEPVGTTFTD